VEEESPPLSFNFTLCTLEKKKKKEIEQFNEPECDLIVFGSSDIKATRRRVGIVTLDHHT